MRNMESQLLFDRICQSFPPFDSPTGSTDSMDLRPCKGAEILTESKEQGGDNV